ncbi:hypothetical protein KIN20_024821 [Parelaphostrongylus tenuis]|uniref:Uncharacterized protein n=1 Tax=Parelaphostrongylus tenuis TaxID=148309 RepID=A0AAD5MU31_PARTN|nr:hypothetical protein KIN20_024803 [Parelaphostrongylus tenuis]KAJ1364684.1 hypothetical protein KIN20_024821 [Parelaphostrongylus tenuis]
MPGCGVPEDVVVDLQKELRNDKFELREKLSKIRSTLFASKARLDEFEERVDSLPGASLSSVNERFTKRLSPGSSEIANLPD